MLDNTADTLKLRNELMVKLPFHMVVYVDAICDGVHSIIVERSRHGRLQIIPTEYHLDRCRSYYIRPYRVWVQTISEVISLILKSPQVHLLHQQSTTSETPPEEICQDPQDMITGSDDES